MSLQVLQEFKDSLIKFFDELIDQFSSEPDLVIIRILLKDQIPITDILNYFIREILPEKQKIRDRDERFFTEGKSLFGMLPESKADTFKRIWKSPNLDKDDRLAIWRWTDLFVALAEKYQKSMVK